MEQQVTRFLTNITNAGYQQSKGKYRAGDPIILFEQGKLPDANDINKGHPYMIFSLPENPRQPFPNTIAMPKQSDEPDTTRLWATNRLEREEAVVFIGKTPPNVDYYSYRSYLFYRFYPGQCKIKKTFASLGDTINNTNVALDNTTDEKCDQLIVIISTASVNTFNTIKEQLIDAGFSPNCINRDEIPASMVNMGLESGADELLYLCRFGNFGDKMDRIRYFENKNEEYGMVFRITPEVQSTSSSKSILNEDCFLPKFKPRGSGNPEMNELQLLPAINALREQILKKYGSTHQPEDLSSGIWIFEGADAMQRGIDAYGEDRDTTYLRSDPFQLRVNKDEFAIVYGINHKAFGKVIYNTIGVYDSETLSGVTSTSSAADDFGGLAAHLLKGTEWEDQADKLYVWKISRFEQEDKSQHVLNVPYKWSLSHNQSLVNRGKMIPLASSMFVGFRAYIDLETGVGPAWWEMIYDRVIKFSPNN